MTSTITEVANVVAGRAITKLCDLGFKFEPAEPTLLTGADAKLPAVDSESLVVPLELPQGLVEINIAICERV
ncbi:chemotaxis protein CheC [Streptomyces sp. NPDC059072]|uniref:chemotaxis protein CheC n=1 Tax=unclassified Streptomyces TaxID=2593676 RepID=UPI00367FC8F6